jgi:dTDP-glucose 4,6-dehydratase
MIDGKSGDTYHISTRKKISIKDIVLRVFNHMEKDFDKLVKTSEDRLGKDQAYLLNSNKIRKEINWSENYKMDETIIDTINWAEQNIEILKKMPLQYIHKK